MNDRYSAEFQLAVTVTRLESGVEMQMPETLVVWQCNHCGAVVSDPTTHDRFHDGPEAA